MKLKIFITKTVDKERFKTCWAVCTAEIDNSVGYIYVSHDFVYKKHFWMRSSGPSERFVQAVNHELFHLSRKDDFFSMAVRYVLPVLKALWISGAIGAAGILLQTVFGGFGWLLEIVEYVLYAELAILAITLVDEIRAHKNDKKKEIDKELFDKVIAVQKKEDENLKMSFFEHLHQVRCIRGEKDVEKLKLMVDEEQELLDDVETWKETRKVKDTNIRYIKDGTVVAAKRLKKLTERS